MARPILRKRTNSALSGEALFDPRDRISTTTIFHSLESIPRDAGRPGLARTSCIQVYKTLRRRWFRQLRGEGRATAKKRPRGTVSSICCFGFRGARSSYERGESLSPRRTLFFSDACFSACFPSMIRPVTGPFAGIRPPSTYLHPILFIAMQTLGLFAACATAFRGLFIFCIDSRAMPASFLTHSQSTKCFYAIREVPFQDMPLWFFSGIRPFASKRKSLGAEILDFYRIGVVNRL